MRKPYSTAAAKPNSGPESPCLNQGKGFPANSIVMRVAQRLWPLKTDMALAEKTGTSDRMCRYWLQQRYSLSAGDLVSLLRSEEGLQFLRAIMAGARPVWWRRFERSTRLSALRAAQEQQRREIEQLEMEFGE